MAKAPKKPATPSNQHVIGEPLLSEIKALNQVLNTARNLITHLVSKSASEWGYEDIEGIQFEVDPDRGIVTFIDGPKGEVK